VIVLVAGYGRKSGKTKAVCEIIAATQDAQWTAAKITAHAHGADLTDPVVLEEPNAGSEADTARYLAAGAHRALWVRCSPSDIRRALVPLISGNTIVESNSAVGVIAADLVVFIGGANEIVWKASARPAAAMADVVAAEIGDEILSRVRVLLNEQKR
jgi:hypothetical protein